MLTSCRQFEVLDVAWDATLGSETLDMLLLEHFAEEFKSAHPDLDPQQSPKAPFCPIILLPKKFSRLSEMYSKPLFQNHWSTNCGLGWLAKPNFHHLPLLLNHIPVFI